jgi:redox-sensitive bicupin YhaK (pirin superfamily)
LEKGKEIQYALGSERGAWVHVVRGEVSVNGQSLRDGDAAAITREASVALAGSSNEASEVLLFDLA